jgi:hypothetical protein
VQKQEMREAVELPLTHPDLYRQIGIDPPRGVLMCVLRWLLDVLTKQCHRAFAVYALVVLILLQTACQYVCACVATVFLTSA